MSNGSTKADHCKRPDEDVDEGKDAATRQGATAAISSMHVTTMMVHARSLTVGVPAPSDCSAECHS